jgi:hypothetical protein
MDTLKDLFLKKITYNGNDIELNKAQYYARASRLYFNKQEMRQILTNLQESGDLQLQNQAQKILFSTKPPEYKKGYRTLQL